MVVVRRVEYQGSLLVRMATTMCWDMIDDATHVSDPELITDSKEEVKVRGYMMDDPIP